MKPRRSSRAPLVAALLLLAAAIPAAASASLIRVDSGGDSTSSDLSITQNETVLAQSVDPFPPLLTATVEYNIVGLLIGEPRVATYTGTTDTLVLNLQNGVNEDPIGRVISGDWVYAGGTGSYAGLQGVGRWTIVRNPDDSEGLIVRTTVVGDLRPVPEPASIAALGLGALALLRRRRA